MTIAVKELHGQRMGETCFVPDAVIDMTLCPACAVGMCNSHGRARESASTGEERIEMKAVAVLVAQGTPRTDAFTEGEVNKGSAMSYVRAVDLARELERENAALSAQVVELQKELGQIREKEKVDQLNSWDLF